jgi:hypothetical protein
MRRVTAAVVSIAVLATTASPAFARGHRRHRHRHHERDEFFVALSGELLFAGVTALLAHRERRRHAPVPVVVVAPPPPVPVMAGPPHVVLPPPCAPAPLFVAPAAPPAAPPAPAPIVRSTPVALAAAPGTSTAFSSAPSAAPARPTPCWVERVVVEPAVYEVREVATWDEVEVPVFEDRSTPRGVERVKVGVRLERRETGRTTERVLVRPEVTRIVHEPVAPTASR